MVLYFPPSSHGSGVPDVCDTRRFLGNAAGCHLFLNERDSDVSLRVKWEGAIWHLPAHRLVLTSMSDVFRRMFSVDMMEKNRGHITITDSSPITVKRFLRYLYMGVLDFNNWIEVVDILKIAHKYGVFPLVTLCESQLTTVITFSNVCHLYEMSQMYSLLLLEKQATTLILDAGYIVTATEGFLNLKPKHLEHFLKSKLLIMENECCVLTTLREWAVVNCSRNGLLLTRENVLNEMEPFMKHIRWRLIPEQLRTFVPPEMVENFTDDPAPRRKSFYVAASLQYHISILKFVVELGTFYEDKTSDTIGLSFLKFGVDNHAFVAGFRIVGMFRNNATFSASPSNLTLGRDDNRMYIQFNLNSLPWAKGASVGDYTWRELTAYLPFPVRVDPFGTYVLSLKYGSGRDSSSTRWPYTRLDSGVIATSMGTINFHCCSECYGITQLFMLPAPPNRNVCNDLDT